MKKLNRFLLSALLILAPAFAAPAFAQQINTNIVGYTLTTDVCQNPTVAKTHALVNISTATTTQLVALSGVTVVYVCNFTASVVGTTPTVLFETGTGSACGTGTASITGTFAPTTGSVLKAEGAGVQFQGAAGGALCVVSGGTTPSIQGYVVYVQQ